MKLIEKIVEELKFLINREVLRKEGEDIDTVSLADLNRWEKLLSEWEEVK